MAKNENRRLSPAIIAANRTALVAVQRMQNYAPANQRYNLLALNDISQAMERARQAEIHAQNDLAAAQDAARMAEWAMHNAMLGVKDQVIAQYGPDADEVQALGLKKRSERRLPTRRKA